MPILNNTGHVKTADGDSRPAPEMLAGYGPIIQVTIHLPDLVQRAYSERGDKVPAPVNGIALIDTGATITCIDRKAAEKASLPVTGVTTMSTASHANQECPTYASKIVFPTINFTVQNAMGANLTSLGGTVIDTDIDTGNDLIVLLGRDFLANAILIYNGPSGAFSLAV